jgi:hypothetical protein
LRYVVAQVPPERRMHFQRAAVSSESARHTAIAHRSDSLRSLWTKDSHHQGYGTKHPDHYACAGAAGAAQYFHNPCKGGAVTARRAEELVVTAVMNSAPAVLRSEIAGLYSNLRDEHYWADATTAERRHVLATVIDKVVLIPRPEGTARGRGQPRDRELRLIWKPEFVSADGNHECVSVLLPDPQSTSKVCEECGLRKRLIDFPKNAHRADHRGPMCHMCRGREDRRTLSFPALPAEPRKLRNRLR